MASDLVERLRGHADKKYEMPRNTRRMMIEAAARIEELEASVEQAFRDGLAYGSNVVNADPDIAWDHSRAKAALKP